MASPISEVAGVGAVFERNRDGELYVHNLISGGSAERSSRVRPGDVLVAIGDISVQGRNWSEIRPIVMGPAGSIVRMHFRRGNNMEEVRLMRGSPEYFEMMEDQRRAEGDLDAVALKLREAGTEIQSLQNEIGRLRSRSGWNEPPSAGGQQLQEEIMDVVEQTRRVQEMMRRAESQSVEENRLREEAQARLHIAQEEVANLRQVELELQRATTTLRARHQSEAAPLERRVAMQEAQLVEHHRRNNEMQAQLDLTQNTLAQLLAQLEAQRQSERELLRRFRESVRFADEIGKGFEEQTHQISAAFTSFDEAHMQFVESMQPPPDIVRGVAAPIAPHEPPPRTAIIRAEVATPHQTTSAGQRIMTQPRLRNTVSDNNPIFLA